MTPDARAHPPAILEKRRPLARSCRIALRFLFLAAIVGVGGLGMSNASRIGAHARTVFGGGSRSPGPMTEMRRAEFEQGVNREFFFRAEPVFQDEIEREIYSVPIRNRTGSQLTFASLRPSCSCT